MERRKKVRDILKLTAALLLISVIAGLALAITFKSTKEQVEHQAQETRQTALSLVLPDGVTVVEKSGSGPIPEVYWEARDGDVTVGYAFLVSNRGYSSDVKVMVGVDTAGIITGMSVLEEVETPGLGDRMVEVASKLYIWNGLFTKQAPQAPWFCRQFKGINVTKPIEIDKSGEWHAQSAQSRKALINRNAVSAITGATISTRTVTSALNKTAAAALCALRSGK